MADLGPLHQDNGALLSLLFVPHILHEMAQVQIFISVIHLCVCMLSGVWLCNPMDCSPPGSSVHGISQARILEWVAISFSRGSSWPRDQICVSCIGREILYIAWAISTGKCPTVINSGEYHIYQANVESNYTTHSIINTMAFIKEFPFRWWHVGSTWSKLNKLTFQETELCGCFFMFS